MNNTEGIKVVAMISRAWTTKLNLLPLSHSVPSSLGFEDRNQHRREMVVNDGKWEIG